MLHNSTPVCPSSAAKYSLPSTGLNTSSGPYPDDGNPSPAPGLTSATSTGTPPTRRYSSRPVVGVVATKYRVPLTLVRPAGAEPAEPGFRSTTSDVPAV